MGVMSLRPEQIRKKTGGNKCPVCGFGLVKESLAFTGRSKYDNKNKQGISLGPVIQTNIYKGIESALFSAIGCKRPDYWVCTNEECPLHWTMAHPYLFTVPIDGIPVVSLRGDFGGVGAMFLGMGYKKNPPKK